jgi:hypothetical protein
LVGREEGKPTLGAMKSMSLKEPRFWSCEFMEKFTARGILGEMSVGRDEGWEELDLLPRYWTKRRLLIERNELGIVLALAVVIDCWRGRRKGLRLVVHKPPGNLH